MSPYTDRGGYGMGRIYRISYTASELHTVLNRVNSPGWVLPEQVNTNMIDLILNSF